MSQRDWSDWKESKKRDARPPSARLHAAGQPLWRPAARDRLGRRQPPSQGPLFYNQPHLLVLILIRGPTLRPSNDQGEPYLARVWGRGWSGCV